MVLFTQQGSVSGLSMTAYTPVLIILPAANTPGARATPQEIFRAATVHAGQASVPRLSQGKSYVFPTPINPSLASAHRVKALAKSNIPFRGPALNPLAQRPRAVTPVARYNIFMTASVYPLPTATKNGQLKQLKLVEVSFYSLLTILSC